MGRAPNPMPSGAPSPDALRERAPSRRALVSTCHRTRPEFTASRRLLTGCPCGQGDGRESQLEASVRGDACPRTRRAPWPLRAAALSPRYTALRLDQRGHGDQEQQDDREHDCPGVAGPLTTDQIHYLSNITENDDPYPDRAMRLRRVQLPDQSEQLGKANESIHNSSERESPLGRSQWRRSFRPCFSHL